jgi:hypothetical protein
MQLLWTPPLNHPHSVQMTTMSQWWHLMFPHLDEWPNKRDLHGHGGMHVIQQPHAQYLNAITITTTQAIADTGATSIFIMEGADVDNKRIAENPLTINLPDGKKVLSSHVCDINIPGLPTMLTGHIIPSLKVTSLIGIRPLCKAGCKV